MSKLIDDPLGDEIKELESRYEQRVAQPGQFLLARADGRAFHTFTRDLLRPFDQRMSDAMLYTTQQLCHLFNARLAYTQSDEITLCFYYEPSASADYPFGGRLQKLCSLIAAQASVLFYSRISESMPEKTKELPVFDCRVFKTLTFESALNTFIWREKDARKNAVSMAASSVYKPKDLEGVSTSSRLKMLAEKGINFNADYSTHFKKGVYFHRQEREVLLDPETLLKIPEGKSPANGMVIRRAVEPAKFESLLELTLETKEALFGLKPTKA
jgi:tRNA(His) guanylyltransferase